MLNITMTSNFEKSYKVLPEIVRKQIKVAVRKLSNDPGCKPLNTKYYDPNNKLCESSVSNNCKLIWKFKSTKSKDIILVNILYNDGTNEVLDKLSNIDGIIRERHKKEREQA
jgi:hypothetical protein